MNDESSPVAQKKLTLAELVQAVNAEIHSENSEDLIERVRALMTAYDADLNEWKRYEFFDEKRYTRNLIATDNDKFALMLLCWNKGNESAIHDHAGSNCWLRVVSGTVVETRFRFPEGEEALQQTQVSTCPNGSVAYIHDTIGLHRISNASNDEPAVTLHLYSPPFDSCKVFLRGNGIPEERGFVYFSEHGLRVEYD
eukprot:TRINITY_DN1982_c0_g1_i4.p1 TRINITY_DN1982_c0_g1~~TRINITY_DN1982_c0_g1_i4.p1  ORF type:complete len:220 (-),score=85.28 TRINITY_DN1982_c0_g1_i4:328-918(-)